MRKVITVIVPAYNEQGFIADCLDSLHNQTLEKEKYEIIVVDNNSTDLTARIAQDKGVRVEIEPRKGYVHALRKGISLCETELIAFTDADWLEKILADFTGSVKIVAVGGKLAFYDLLPVVDKIIRGILYFNQALPGNNMAVKRQALEWIGGVDPGVNLSVDYWLTIKLRKIGKNKIDRSLVVQTSGRRLKGSFDSDIKYFINVMSLQVSSRPIFYDFPDIRD